MDLKTYTLYELSKSLGVSVDTLRAYVKSGRLKAVKVCNKYIVSEDNYRAFINGK